ncbi:cell envelope integrity protein TolA [Polluticaenibacter yanchengensis]|uniref:Cell envelope integrity protein TolA n=1 Tax=Polluticaenibacter yanchengensis TaxID=3014562 RepID=A0ABT4UKI7_9BACT|nr:cell envelope integrity protein TolA [Chitinophagaceae bacterium LY-5]
MKNLEITVNHEQYGIEETKAVELVGKLPQIKSERSLLEDSYNDILKMDIDDPSTSKAARELRLKIKDNRTKGIEVWHKNAKDFFLKGGQFVDAIKKVEVSINQRMEENLEQIEKHFEIKEAARKKEISDLRISKLHEYSEFVPMGLNFGEMSEDEFSKIFNGAKLQYEAKIERERKEEQERERIKAIESLRWKRSDDLRPYYDYFAGTLSDDVKLGEISEDEYQAIKSALQVKKEAHAKEQERIKAENDRLAKEKAEMEAKAKKEKEESDRKLAELKAKQDEELRVEREKNAKIEADLKAKKEAEIKAENERKALEEKANKEAAELAKKPLKEQMKKWVSEFELPLTNVSHEKVNDIIKKFESFKNWAEKEIESI